jgi:hypothetical protein
MLESNISTKRSIMYIFLLQFLLSVVVNAGPVADVEKVHGSVYSESQQVVKGIAINEESKIELKDSAVVFLKLKQSQARIRVAGPGAVFIKHEKNEDSVNIIQGVIRSLTNNRTTHKKDAQDPYIIKTPTAVVGVRGTDFTVSYQPLLSEVEVIVFDGTIELVSLSNSKDSKSITKGHWGGLGGRFGKKISDLMVLPQSVLDYFDHANSWEQ